MLETKKAPTKNMIVNKIKELDPFKNMTRNEITQRLDNNQMIVYQSIDSAFNSLILNEIRDFSDIQLLIHKLGDKTPKDFEETPAKNIKELIVLENPNIYTIQIDLNKEHNKKLYLFNENL